MNEKQKKYLEEFIQKNKFFGEKEAEWAQPECVHTFQLEGLIEKILKIK